MWKAITKSLASYVDGFSFLIYPSFCILCKEELTSQEEYFCFSCSDDLHYTSFELYTDATISEELFWGRSNIENVYSLLYFEKGNSTQEILHQIKYNEGRDLGRHMGKMIGERLKNHPNYQGFDAIIPVPVHTKKEFSRGYNQSLLIAEGVGNELGVPVEDILHRTKNDASQTRKTVEERLKNVKGKFAVKMGLSKQLNKVLIVDDVLTTGSTLDHVVIAVQEVYPGIKISLATIAVVG